MKNLCIILLGSFLTVVSTISLKAFVTPDNWNSYWEINAKMLNDTDDRTVCENCYNGGIGSTSCSVEGGIEIVGFGTTASCSVTCADGFFACCSIKCICCFIDEF